MRLFMQGLPESALHEVALGPVDGRAAHTEALGNGLVRHPGVGGQQDLSSIELSGGMLATAEQRPKLRALGFTQLDPISYVHLASPSREAQMNHCVAMSAESFTDRQGQYLAFIDAYTRVHGRPPGRGRHAAPFPGTRMVLTLERLGHIRRQPGVARSIEVLLAPEDLPVLRHPQAVKSSVPGN
jgi:hypothetical protein